MHVGGSPTELDVVLASVVVISGEGQAVDEGAKVQDEVVGIRIDEGTGRL